MGKHLDLGCGLTPRNPYFAQFTYGCDIREINASVEELGFVYKKVNLVIEPIPYPDNYFESVSAYDFLEHIPRQMILSNGEACNPFTNLMSEIHRVLVPGGRFLAFTPAFPHSSAFTDPTHVNFITDQTHQYFIGEYPFAAMYGFKGRFDIVQARREAPKNFMRLNQPDWRKAIRRIQLKIFSDGLPHMLWELTARK